jgi:hypothetical protein
MTMSANATEVVGNAAALASLSPRGACASSAVTLRARPASRPPSQRPHRQGGRDRCYASSGGGRRSIGETCVAGRCGCALDELGSVTRRRRGRPDGPLCRLEFPHLNSHLDSRHQAGRRRERPQLCCLLPALRGYHDVETTSLSGRVLHQEPELRCQLSRWSTNGFGRPAKAEPAESEAFEYG